MNFWDSYRNFFKIQEIENSKILQYLYFAIILSFLFSFNIIAEKNYNFVPANTDPSFYNIVSNTVCPPFFLHCHDILSFFHFFDDYNPNIFFTFVLLILLGGANFAYKKDWLKAHISLLLATCIKFLWMYIFTYGLYGNYDYYDLALAIIWLFATEKEYFTKLSFVWFYFLASTVKFDGSWIFANYFRSLVYGLPFVPDSFMLLATNIVIFTQIVGAFFLLSNNKRYQKIAFYFFILFHIYSGFLVLFRYLVISLTAEFILFHEFVTFHIKKISLRTIFGYSFLVFLLVIQLFPFFITKDYKKTMEGIYYGLYMFHASDQCKNFVKENYKDGTSNSYSFERHNVPFRCDAYYVWYYLQKKCQENPNIASVHWEYYISINGNMYDKQVDTDNACALSYSYLSHNDWLKTQNVSTNMPVYKTNYNNYLDPNILIPTNPIIANRLLTSVKVFYWSSWIFVLIFCVSKVIMATDKKQEGNF